MIRLAALAGPEKGRAVVLHEGDTLGRLPDGAFVAPHASVSRVHARIERRGGAYWIVDAGSRNGVFVDGERVEAAPLGVGDEFSLGEFAVRVDAVELEGSDAGGAPEPIAEAFEFDLEPSVEKATTDAGIELEDPTDIAIGTPEKAPRRVVEPVISEAKRRQAEYLAGDARSRSGLARGELTQQPVAVQILVFAAVIAFAGAIAWGVFALVAAGN
ncbi:MAG: FHA domain-containing protein [Planctomycetota bacterium]